MPPQRSCHSGKADSSLVTVGVWLDSFHLHWPGPGRYYRLVPEQTAPSDVVERPATRDGRNFERNAKS